MRKPLAIAGFAFGLAALALQLSLTIPASLDAGRGLGASLIFYFSFFTILTNILVVLVYAGAAFPAAWLQWFRDKRFQGMAAAAIAFVMIFYHLLLLALWQPEGLWLVCDIALHYIAPTAYLLYWAAFLSDGSLRTGRIWAWLPYPVLYLAYVYLRGALIGEYPYPVLDPRPAGWGAMVATLFWLFAAYVLLCLLVIGLDKLKARFLRRAA